LAAAEADVLPIWHGPLTMARELGAAGFPPDPDALAIFEDCVNIMDQHTCFKPECNDAKHYHTLLVLYFRALSLIEDRYRLGEKRIPIAAMAYERSRIMVGGN
jgi:hypothetical protein